MKGAAFFLAAATAFPCFATDSYAPPDYADFLVAPFVYKNDAAARAYIRGVAEIITLTRACPPNVFQALRNQDSAFDDLVRFGKTAEGKLIADRVGAGIFKTSIGGALLELSRKNGCIPLRNGQ